jgi:molecular chaperone GrpE
MSNKKVDERDELKKKTARKDIEEDIGEELEGSIDEKPSETTQETKAPETREAEEDLKVQYLRLLADYQNFKKRTEKEKTDIYAFANEKIARELLEVMDNFERAMSHTMDSSDANLVNGMTAIFKQLRGVLEKNGIAELSTDGQAFDPSFHHAVSTESTEDFKSGHVVETLQKGYTLKGKVIRPALVKVAE